uniref:Uncharacterized protein n=1 Tax=viral metagenome TaxID=1070528 RepID=A0A6C0BSK2_9ZZZZ
MAKTRMNRRKTSTRRKRGGDDTFLGKITGLFKKEETDAPPPGAVPAATTDVPAAGVPAAGVPAATTNPVVGGRRHRRSRKTKKAKKVKRSKKHHKKSRRGRRRH